VNSYEVRRYPMGVAVIGPIPIDELLALTRAWKKEGLNWCDAVIAGHLKASFVVCKKRDSDLWRAELGLTEKGKEAKGVTLSLGV